MTHSPAFGHGSVVNAPGDERRLGAVSGSFVGLGEQLDISFHRLRRPGRAPLEHAHPPDHPFHRAAQSRHVFPRRLGGERRAPQPAAPPQQTIIRRTKLTRRPGQGRKACAAGQQPQQSQRIETSQQATQATDDHPCCHPPALQRGVLGRGRAQCAHLRRQLVRHARGPVGRHGLPRRLRAPGQRLPGGRLERNPPLTREIQFRPGVRVHLGDNIFAAPRVELPHSVADRQARGNAVEPRQHHHRRGEVVAISLLQVEQEPGGYLAASGRRGHVQRVRQPAQRRFDGDGAVVRGGRSRGGDLRGVCAELRRHISRELQVGRGNLRRVVLPGSAQNRGVHIRHAADDRVLGRLVHGAQRDQLARAAHLGPVRPVDGHRLARGKKHHAVRPRSRDHAEHRMAGCRRQIRRPRLARCEALALDRTRVFFPAEAVVDREGLPPPVDPLIRLGAPQPHAQRDRPRQLRLAAQEMRSRQPAGRDAARRDQRAAGAHAGEAGAHLLLDLAIGALDEPPKCCRRFVRGEEGQRGGQQEHEPGDC